MSTLQKIKKINSNKISLVDWIMIGIVLFTFFLTMFYGDIIHTDTCSMKLLDCIREDNLLHYYTYCVEHPINDVVRAGYYMPIYIIFAIWNLPVWIVVRFFGINIYAVPCFL